ncbi:GntR family transcriptional regulator [Pseudonocardia kunmingensis]|uniref:GntR family transcriptional regulator n=2 Tax=Pseudonocardia kunmingensis TaxID=630975 RepID=A0A543DPY4_9PSEU|nr:GntR family transcriptional regulator [Pseudonocardia kunmingensis]
MDQAEDALRSLIKEYQAAGASRLPPESRLCELVGASRSTLRDALSRLEVGGEITRRRRVGTMITAPSRAAHNGSLAYPVDLILSLSDFLSQAGVSYAVRAVSIAREHADDGDVAMLGVEACDPVYRAIRLYEVEGRAAARLEHRLPASFDSKPVRINALTDGITTFLEQTENVRLTRSDHTINAEAADDTLAGDLEVPVGTPLLVIDCQLYAAGSHAVATGRLVFRPDVLRLAASANPSTSSTGRIGTFGLTAVETPAPPSSTEHEPG